MFRPTIGGMLFTPVRPARPSRLAGVIMAGFHSANVGELRMVPHPSFTLVLDFGDGRPVIEDGAHRLARGSLVAGPGFGAGGTTRALGDGVHCVQVRLAPVVVHDLLGVPPAAFGEAADLFGPDVDLLRERLAEAASWDERFALTDAWLAARRARRSTVDIVSTVDPEVERVWDLMVARRGAVRVDDLAAEVGWSRKRLWSRFQAQTGLPPKRAASLVRFDHAVHRLVAGDGAARVAAECGYADQSHLHRDVVSFSGATPATVTGEAFLLVDDVAWPRSDHLYRSTSSTVATLSKYASLKKRDTSGCEPSTSVNP
jgi:AraC-like DNA-binding protein